MTKLTFIEPSGKNRDIDVETGQSVMLAASRAGVEGIPALCGGAAMCGTCHSLVIEAPNGLPEIQAAEADTLEFTSHGAQKNSRLICQIEVTPEIEGTGFKVMGR